MSAHFEKEVAELRQRGITLDQLTADEVEELVLACKRMANPFSECNLEAVGMPVVLADGTTLYNLTIGASVWLDEFAFKWWGKQTKAYFWALVYALANGRTPESFSGEMTSPEKAKERIVKMAARIHITEDELLDGIYRAMHNRRERTENASGRIERGTDWGELIRTMEATTGIPSRYWAWECSSDWVVREYHKQRQFIKAMKGEREVRMKDELDYATNALARIRSSILGRLGKLEG